MANLLADVFGRSPVQPLEKHIDVACQCAAKMQGFFEAVTVGDWDQAQSVFDEIVSLERKADDIKQEIRLHLPKSLFMPVSRQDLLELLLVQDRIANRSCDAVGLVLGRKLQIPATLSDEFLEFVARVIDAASQARKSVRELDELFTTSFRGAEVDLVSSMIEELDRIEDEVLQKRSDLYSAVYKIEDSLNPVDAIFIYRVIDRISSVALMGQRVGRRMELLLAH